ncbi:hypothetical protein ACFL2M_02210, partial [Patescibacteria group bacterium]
MAKKPPKPTRPAPKEKTPEGELNPSIEATVDQADRRTAELQRQAEELIATAEQDLERTGDPNAAKAVKAMQALAQQTDQVEETFLQRLRRLAAIPAAAWKKFREERTVKQLAIPDNPKVRRRIEKLLKVKPPPVRDILFLYDQAAKTEADEYLWELLRTKINTTFYSHMTARFAEGNIAAAIELFDGLAEETRRLLAWETLYKITDDLRHSDEAKKAKSGKFDIENYLQLREHFKAAEAELLQTIKGRKELSQEYQTSARRGLIGDLFDETGEFLFNQPSESIEALTGLTSEQQEYVVDKWPRLKDIDWVAILNDPEAATIIGLLMEFHFMTTYKPEQDREHALKIANTFTPEQRAAALEKTTHRLGNWELVYTIILVASQERISADDIEGLDASRAEEMAAAIHINGEDAFRSMLTREKVCDFLYYQKHYARWSNYVPNLLERAKALTPELRRHIPTTGGGEDRYVSSPDAYVPGDEGIQGVVARLNGFLTNIKIIPGEYRDVVFAYLKPVHYSSKLNEEPISLEAAQNFIEFCKLHPGEKRMTLSQLDDVRDYFSPERWPLVKKGILIFLRMGTLDQTEPSRHWFEVFEAAANPEAGQVNRIVEAFMKQGDSFVDPRRDAAYRLQERSANGILQLYEFFPTCQELFSNDTEQMFQYEAMEEQDRIVIRALLDGSLAEHAHELPDLPIIEGVLGRLSYKYNSRGKSDQWQLDKFKEFTAEQKETWLFLKNNISWPGGYLDVEAFDLVESDEGKQVAEFIERIGLVGFNLECVRKMVAREDCIGWFYYLLPSNITSENAAAAIDKFIELNDAGLPAHYKLESFKQQSITEWGTWGGDRSNTIQTLLDWDAGKLVQVAQLLAEKIPELNLSTLLSIDEASDKPYEELAMMVERSALLEAEYLITYGDAPSEERNQELARRINFAASMLEAPLSSKQRERLEYMPAAAWEKLEAEPALIPLIMGSEAYFSESKAQLPDDVLSDPLFWKHSLPEDVCKDENTARIVLNILRDFKAAGIEAGEWNYAFSTQWPDLVQAYQNAPWLFFPENISSFVGRPGMIIACADYSQDEFAQLRQALEAYSPVRSQFKDFSEAVLGSELLLTGPQQRKIQQLLGVRIPWPIASAISEQLKQGRDLDELVAEYDDNKDAPYQWKAFRVKVISGSIDSDLINKEYRPFSSIQILKKIAALPEPTLQAFLQLDITYGLSDRLVYKFGEEALVDRAVLLAEHENFGNILRLLEKEKYEFSSILEQPPEQLRAFCNDFNTTVLERYLEVCDQVQLQVVDAPAFFNLEQSEQVVERALKLKELVIEGSSRPSVYRALVIPDADIAYVQQLERQSLISPINSLLRLHETVATGKAKDILQRVRMIDSHEPAENTTVLLDAIAGLPDELRKPVFDELLNNFGWSIMEHRSQLRERLGFSDSLIDSIIVEYYDRCTPGKIPSLDKYTIEVICGDSTIDDDKKAHRMDHIRQYYKGELQQLVEIFNAHPKAFAQMLAINWRSTPEEMRHSPEALSALLEEPESLATIAISYWSKLPKDFRESQKVYAVLAERPDALARTASGYWNNFPDEWKQSPEFWETMKKTRGLPMNIVIEFIRGLPEGQEELAR